MSEEQQRAWLYCRIDAPEDALGRLKGQRRELASYAEQLGLDIVGVSQDTGSGRNMERSGLREVQEAAGAGRMEVLLVTQGSRIGRSMMQTIAFIEQLNRQGVAVYSALEGELAPGRGLPIRPLPQEEAKQEAPGQDGKALGPDGPALQWNG